MERLLLRRFLGETKPIVPEHLIDVSAEPNSFKNESIAQLVDFTKAFESFKEGARQGNLGKTAQFWMIYLDMMRVQHFIHIAVQENDFDLRFYAWQFLIPFYFALDKQNYARYGSFYVETLKNIDRIYPGLRSLLEKKGISVLGQSNHNIRTAIDQRGEQTINRDAKTTGGIKKFAGNENNVLKWCLNRADQARHSGALNDMCELAAGTGMYLYVEHYYNDLYGNLVITCNSVINSSFSQESTNLYVQVRYFKQTIKLLALWMFLLRITSTHLDSTYQRNSS